MDKLNTIFYLYRKEVLIICLVGLCVFFNSFFNPFIADDESQIVQNKVIHSIFNFPIFFTGGSFTAGGDTTGIYYKPLFNTALSITYSVFGATPFFFHFNQLALHIINSILIFVFFAQFLRRQIALFISLIFLVHPINAEAVVYISNTQEPLFFFFGMLGLLLLTKKHITTRTLYISQLFLLLSLLSKETGLLFLIIAFTYILLFKRPFIKLFSLASFIMFSIYLFFRLIIAGIYFNERAISPIMHASLLERIQSIPAILFYYFKTFLYPQTLLFSQHWVVVQPDFNSFLFPLIVDAVFLLVFMLISYCVIKTSSKLIKPVIFFSIWFSIGLLLHAQIFPLDVTVSDRWFYFPIVGILGVLALALQIAIDRINFARKNIVLLTIVVVIISLLSIRTIVRNANWLDPVTLYTNDLALMKPNFALESALASEYLDRNELSKALEHAHRSVEIYPTYLNLTNLGAVYIKSGDIQKGKMYYEQALEKGNFYLTYQSLAGVIAFYDPPEEAKNTIATYIKRYPNNSRLYIYYAIAAYRGGDKEEAKKYTLYACKISNDAQCQKLLYGIENNLPINKP